MLKWDNSAFSGLEKLTPGPREAILVANGDQRRTANLSCQKAQLECERQLRAAFERQGWKLLRAHPEVDPELGHCFIETQAQGRDIFARIPKDAPLVVAEAVWQYSNHVVYNLWEHRGPILVASNFDGQWPGLVGALGLEACLTRHAWTREQKGHSLLWSSEEFRDKDSVKKLKEWLAAGAITHDTSHAREFGQVDKAYAQALKSGEEAAADFRARPRILGLYDPLCMGMINAAFDERDMAGLGIQLRRLSQSDLYSRMQDIPRAEALGYIKWLVDRGFKLEIGSNPFSEITEKSVIESGRMYAAMTRNLAEERMDGLGIAYQLGLAHLTSASDLAEAMLNSSDRPPVEYRGARVMPGEPIMCANEADMGCAVDQAMSKAIYRASSLPPRLWETTQHDVRWGDTYKGSTKFTGKGKLKVEAFLWAFELSGNTPSGHAEKGWADMEATRQPYEFFVEGGICTRCTARPGELVWSRVYLDGGRFHLDIGRGAALDLPKSESRRRWDATTEQWPLMHALLYGVSRDQLMAKHKSNHITVSYAPDPESANAVAYAKAAMARALGMKVFLCGDFETEASVSHKASRGLPVEGPFEK